MGVVWRAAPVYPVDVSPDGRLALLSISTDQRTDLYVMEIDAPDAEPVKFLATPRGETAPKFSPDGRWIAYTSDETGKWNVSMRPYPGPGGKWQISGDGGIDPFWSPDGRQIHYLYGREWWVVDVDTGIGAAGAAGRAGEAGSVGQAGAAGQAGEAGGDDRSAPGRTFRAGAPRLVRRDMPRAEILIGHDLSHDGQAIIAADNEDAASTPGEIRVVVDWFEEVRGVWGS